ncbi:MAG: tRNA (guanosine(37)-N1)-methyltransferase TrmD [Planctomycetes bacterium]|nr:tRNA (guanosine(37)-N1)-methyltransferase TrmD [Planctomycetota bacterium]
MRIDILTLFPGSLVNALNSSILKIAQKKGLIQIQITNIRDFTKDKHKKVDSHVYGGGSGMLLQIDPILNAIDSLIKGQKDHNEKPFIILTSPRGAVFNQSVALNLSVKQWLIVICGHYEGVDERIVDILKPFELSIGDYILTGGEPAAWVIIDSVTRLIPNVLGSPESLESESFNQYLLEAPHYTKPSKYKNYSVPKVLLSGNHSEIAKWRLQKSIELTKSRRPDLYRLYSNKNHT